MTSLAENNVILHDFQDGALGFYLLKWEVLGLFPGQGLGQECLPVTAFLVNPFHVKTSTLAAS